MDVLSWQEFVAGWVGGVAGLAVGHPADTIKVRQQAFTEKIGVFKTFRTTLKYEGVRGLYKGMSFPLLSAGALNALFFGVYANTLRFLELDHKTSCTDGSSKEGHKQDKWNTNVFAAGCVGGLFACFLACPIDLIKIQMQSQTGIPSNKEWGHHTEPQHKGMLDCIRRLCHKQGIRGLYTGMGPMLMRDVPSYGLYMLAYEHLAYNGSGRTHIHDFLNLGALIVAGGSAGIVLSWSSISTELFCYQFWQIWISMRNAILFLALQRVDCDSYLFYFLRCFTFVNKVVSALYFSDVVSYGVYMWVYETALQNLHFNHVITTLVSGGTAGVVSWAVITPIDLVKSRIQADDIRKPVYSGFTDCVKKSYRAHGLPVFFRGFSMMMLRSFPVNAATFLVYESSLHLMGAGKRRNEPFLHFEMTK